MSANVSNKKRRRERYYMDTIERRMAHLQRRIESHPERNPNWDRSEHAALSWALAELTFNGYGFLNQEAAGEPAVIEQKVTERTED